MAKRNAYTLIELIIVVSIILLLTAFGLPAFSKYQHLTEFSQKTEEIKELFSLARSMALSPETPSITSYQVHYDSQSTPNKFTVVSCTGTGVCDGQQEINSVSLLSGQLIQTMPLANDKMIFSCKTLFVGGKLLCAQNPDPDITAISFRDINPSVERAAEFTINYDPFIITVATPDSQ